MPVLMILCVLLLNITVYAQDFLKDKSAYFETIESRIKNAHTNQEIIKIDTINQYKRNLRLVQKNAQENILKHQEGKKSQQNLLDILGTAPNKEKGEEEASQLSRIRTEFNNKLITIDGRIKNAQLNVARSENLINELSNLNQEQLQLRLTARLPSPFLPQALVQASQQGLKFIQNMYNNPILIGLSVLALLLNLLSIPILKFLNHKRQEFTRVTFLPIGHRLVVQLIIASIIIMTLRYGDFSIGQYDDLVHLAQALAAIILSMSLYELLGKIKFLNTSNSELAGYVVPFWKSLLKKIQWISLIFIPTSIIGFTEFSSYFIFNIFTVILAVFFFIAMRALVVRGLGMLENTKNNAQTKTHKEIASSASTILIIEPIIAILTTCFALFFWGYDYTEIQIWANQYSNGIPIGKFTINFQDIWAALISFSVIYLFFKMIKWFLSSRVFPKTSLDVGIINTVLTLLGYAGITFAMVSAAAALGFDASNLALVAGALSVGIGFGLQTIFSNFVSGLILLFERPFKVGDWVRVNEFEGIIRKISVRSTEIETFKRSSVIVPNAQMISDVVTNRTLHDAITRIEIPIGVAYGSDIKKVKEILLECAREYKEILNHPEAYVLFMNFGDSSLDFELRFWITSVHTSLGISSDLRFLITQKFHDHNIEIPFPQRDLHIRSGLLNNNAEPKDINENEI